MKKTCVIEWDKDRQIYWVRFMVGETQVDISEYKSIGGGKAAKAISQWTRGN